MTRPFGFGLHHPRSPRWAARTLIVALLSSAPALAEPVFPPGSSIGLAPPPGMTASQRFTGFQGEGGSTILLTELPPEALPQLRSGFTPERLAAQGFSGVKQEEAKVGGRDAVLITGVQTVGSAAIRKWVLLTGTARLTAMVVANGPVADRATSDDALRRAVLSTVVREPLSLEEQVAALPFRVGDLAGFRVLRALSGNGLLLLDGPQDAAPEGEQTMAVVTASFGPSFGAADPDRWARRALTQIEAVKDPVVEDARTFSKDGAAWHEIVARGTDNRTGKPLAVVQVFRFAPDPDRGYLRVIGLAPAAKRDAVVPRFRRLGESVSPRS